MSNLEIALSVVLYLSLGVSTLLWTCYDDLKAGKQRETIGIIGFTFVSFVLLVGWPVAFYGLTVQKIDKYLNG